MTAPPDLNVLSLPALFEELSKGGLVRRALELARDEDLGCADAPERGDITTTAWLPGDPLATARLAAREPGVLAGATALPMLLDLFAPRTRAKASANDGDVFTRGQTLVEIHGPLAEILRLERAMLNLLSRLSGVATLTAEYVSAIGAGSRARLFDTRKTTPGLRMLEKYAVRCGGGCCHRLGLHDAVLIKDNHLAGVPTADLPRRLSLAATNARADRALRFVEVEVDSLDQFESVLRTPAGTVDIVLLDNMTPAMLALAVKRRNEAQPRLQLEASGGVTLSTIREIAATGVDRISAGAVTHGAHSIDLGLDISA